MKFKQGFTLIELMVVVAIIGILAAIVYPSYVQYVTKSNRSAAESFLLSVSNKQEQYVLDARQYAATLSALSLVTPTDVARNYSITVAANNAATPPSYTITATPINTQLANDTKCANLTLDQNGVKGIGGTGTVATCW